MLTNKAKYALKALLHLASLVPGETALSAGIAAANGIPKKFLDAILQDLKTGGFIHSRKGPGGGYALSRPPSQIEVGHVIRVLDGPLAPIACASRSAYRACADCPDVESCRIRRLMVEVRDAISDVLDRTTLEAMQRSTERRSGRGRVATKV